MQVKLRSKGAHDQFLEIYNLIKRVSRDTCSSEHHTSIQNLELTVFKTTSRNISLTEKVIATVKEKNAQKQL